MLTSTDEAYSYCRVQDRLCRNFQIFSWMNWLQSSVRLSGATSKVRIIVTLEVISLIERSVGGLLDHRCSFISGGISLIWMLIGTIWWGHLPNKFLQISLLDEFFSCMKYNRYFYDIHKTVMGTSFQESLDQYRCLRKITFFLNLVEDVLLRRVFFLMGGGIKLTFWWWSSLCLFTMFHFRSVLFQSESSLVLWELRSVSNSSDVLSMHSRS